MASPTLQRSGAARLGGDRCGGGWGRGVVAVSGRRTQSGGEEDGDAATAGQRQARSAPGGSDPVMGPRVVARAGVVEADAGRRGGGGGGRGPAKRGLPVIGPKGPRGFGGFGCWSGQRAPGRALVGREYGGARPRARRACAWARAGESEGAARRASRAAAVGAGEQGADSPERHKAMATVRPAAATSTVAQRPEASAGKGEEASRGEGRGPRRAPAR
nr:spidroin-2-like [Aegilops tauschii subsp. strangulata]